MILVTGGRGFIGRSVCSVLFAHGKPVVALDRKGLSGSADKRPYLSAECNIEDKDHVERIFRQYPFTVVVHLASLLKTASQKNPVAATRINIGGSLNILETARRFRVPRMIYGSSISVYGSKSDRGWDAISETESAVPEDVYGATKRVVEVLGEAYRQRFGVQFIALRISSVVGPGAASTSSPWRSDLFEKLGLPHRAVVSIPYRNDEALPLVHVEDVADMFERLIDAEHTSSAIYNAPSETWTFDELARAVEALDPNVRIDFGSSCVGGIPRAINGQRLITEFGYTPMPLKERLERAFRSRKATVAERHRRLVPEQ